MLTCVHPGASPEQAVEQTGWPLRVAAGLGETDAPTEAELTALRALRTAGDAAAPA